MTSASKSETLSVGRGGWRRPTGRSLFLAVLLVILAVYTQMAFDLEWRTVAGRIGPGFFPRIIGLLSLAIILWALVTSLRVVVVRTARATPSRTLRRCDRSR